MITYSQAVSYCIQVTPHKYWYDILMGFKTELLSAYFLTLVFVLAAITIISAFKHGGLDCATSHIENITELNTAQYQAETDRLHKQKKG